MPQLRVEYAKSGRARCSLPACGQPIARHEVRIGTAVVFPPRSSPDGNPNAAHNSTEAEEGTTSYKWRHLCCFTQRQLQNATAAGDLDNMEGFEDLAPADQALVNCMKRGELVEKTDVKGRVGDIANSRLAAELLPKGSSPAKKGKSTSSTSTSTSTATKAEGGEAKKKGTRTTKRTREKSEEENNKEMNKNTKSEEKKQTKNTKSEEKKEKEKEKEMDGAESDGTIEYDVSVVMTKPNCPYGEKCFRTGAEHRAEYTHGTEEDKNVPARPRAVIKGKK